MFPVMKNGKEFYFPKGRRGSKGEPAVPPKRQSSIFYYFIQNWGQHYPPDSFGFQNNYIDFL